MCLYIIVVLKMSTHIITGWFCCIVIFFLCYLLVCCFVYVSEIMCKNVVIFENVLRISGFYYFDICMLYCFCYYFHLLSLLFLFNHYCTNITITWYFLYYLVYSFLFLLLLHLVCFFSFYNNLPFMANISDFKNVVLKCMWVFLCYFFQCSYCLHLHIEIYLLLGFFLF